MGLLDNLFGTPTYGGLLGEQDQQAAKRQAMLALTTGLLEAGGPSPVPISTGQAIGRGLQAANVGQQQSIEQSLKAALLRKQMEPRPVAPPASVQEYEYAKQQGYKGTFDEWTRAGSTGSVPAAVQEYEYAKQNGFKGTLEEWKLLGAAKPQAPSGIQEYEYFNKLTPEQQKQFLSLQRSPVVPQLSIVNGVPTLVDRTDGSVKPLSTQESEADAARIQSQAKAYGAAIGELQASTTKKGISANVVSGIVDLAEPLVDIATGSAVGAGMDKVTAFFGGAPDGARAISELKVLQAALMLNQPRMEGPQSDKDVQLYREAAASLGDPMVPRAIKRSAINTIRKLQDKYKEAAAAASPSSSEGWKIEKE